MEIHLPKSGAIKRMRVLQSLCQEFPQVAPQILEVNLQSKHGVTIEVKPLKTRRSRPQENYYRKWCGGFAKFCGLTPDEMHNELLCQCYGSEEINTKFGVVRRPVKRSNDATRGDYSELIETLCRVAAQMGYDVPPPEVERE
jgi:hypothetical protein